MLTIKTTKTTNYTYSGECDSEHPAARVFGGHVLAQAMSAAYYTAPEGFYVHAVHCYFIRGGMCKCALVRMFHYPRGSCLQARSRFQSLIM